MQIRHTDFNGAGALFADSLAKEWRQIELTLIELSLHLKASDQASIQGRLIFDPVGTNAAIKTGLEGTHHWSSNVPMPHEFRCLGKGFDFAHNGVLVEVQFSNYPFLLNNTVRAELVFKSRTLMAGTPVGALVIISKANMFPASNSTLYYEQGVNQLVELSRNGVFDVPTRMVGLFSDIGMVDAVCTNYHALRYSRTVVEQTIKRVDISGTPPSRCRIVLA